ncbi:NO-inducible flavohemoprotein [Oceanospirillum linum]|uniref:Flavohemoprotein n=1 Tax=Oceanospirillum linum TaxID=966 RepID=A0A1T1HEA3_OCELI|nr:NO-inducible flavohemoprotein [Oceanospirillum linum]OOV88153.1 nitric oxide dioxygenase [Oceanospirillum linum]SEF45138.1 nitric oxide dioxygenase [Oleiphilus messinensis]SMP01677.1 nitric oxide dioxygenase [Oceanospirillum linum]
MLTPNQIDIVKSTIPLLESAGSKITEHFYTRMFSHNPELKNIFNMSHQHSGRQSVALFNAVAAYARYVDDLPVLQAAVERIAHKHTSFNIRPEQYGIVGHHLIHTLKELAPDAFTLEVEDAWTAAYQQLADIFIQREEALYKENAQSLGGWEGPRRFRLETSKQESERVKSFIFIPVDQQPVVAYKPGQYVGIRVKPSHSEFEEIRQYSLSDASNGSSYRISVKQEKGEVDGLVSNFLHDELMVGDEVDLFAPAGDFYFTDRQQPVVLISAGVGITPMIATLETLARLQYKHPVSFLHACENDAQHSFKHRIKELSKHLSFSAHTWYNQSQDDHSVAVNGLHTGLMSLEAIQSELPVSAGDFYLCGPVAFMAFIKKQLLELGVRSEQIHYEVFGPHADL